MNEPQDVNKPRAASGFPSSFTSHMLFGLVIMTLGALWTLDNLGFLDSDQILRWWPVALIAAGVVKLTGVGSGRNLVLGALLVIAGGWALAHSFGVIDISVWALWPLALVFVGFSILTRHGRRRMDSQPVDTGFGVGTHSSTIDDQERLTILAVWSAVDRKVLSQEFRGGDITAVMGGADIDLRGARAAPEGAVLEVLAVWGGIDLIVPQDWRVVNQATVVMGAIEDKTKLPPVESTQTLIIRGFVMMGGVEIKN